MGIMLLSLLVSGWGNVFAAAFCPHDAGKNLTTKTNATSCHQMGEEQSSHSESHSRAMNGMEMLPVAQPEGQAEIIPVGQLIGTCTHCVGQENTPVTAATARELSLQKRDAGASVEKSAMSEVALTAFFSPKFVPTQNAPPGPANRKHLMLGVFLI
jgi:hypothetical protein